MSRRRVGQYAGPSAARARHDRPSGLGELTILEIEELVGRGLIRNRDQSAHSRVASHVNDAGDDGVALMRDSPNEYTIGEIRPPVRDHVRFLVSLDTDVINKAVLIALSIHNGSFIVEVDAARRQDLGAASQVDFDPLEISL